MKKLLSVAALAAAMLFSATVSAKINLGVKGGVNVTKFSASKDMFQSDNRTGFYIGPTVHVPLLLGLGLDAAALYDQRTVEFSDDEASGELSAHQRQIAIPINVRYGMGLGSWAKVFVFAGPQVGFNLNKTDADETYTAKFKESVFSVNIGAGITFMQHLQVNANYNVACGKTCEVFKSLDLSDCISNGRHNAWQIGLAYWF